MHRPVVVGGLSRGVRSAGIGVEFVRQLAARGSDVVLVARRPDRLERLAGELQAAYGVTATPIAMDLAVPGVAAVLDAALTERGLGITSLINNAGAHADGDTKRMRPDEVVKTALKALDQRTPPPSTIAGARNRLMTHAGRLVSRRRMTMTIGAMMDRAAAAAT